MRLTWQVTAIIIGAMAAGVRALQVVAERNSACDHALVMHHALDRGGRLNGDNIEMPGDAEAGTYPDSEA
jgi:N-acyl-D-aspartate/D-glutamate deacylase